MEMKEEEEEERLARIPPPPFLPPLYQIWAGTIQQITKNFSRSTRTPADHQELQQITKNFSRSPRTPADHQELQQINKNSSRSTRTPADHQELQQITKNSSISTRTPSDQQELQQITKNSPDLLIGGGSSSYCDVFRQVCRQVVAGLVNSRGGDPLVVFCSNLDLIIRRVLPDPPWFFGPGPVRFDVLLDVLLFLVSLWAAVAETLICSVTSKPEGRRQEPSEPIRAHNL
ncbi:uncharacterized protein LOC141754893 [Sebastes fasciatus]|uniref:uncharacterized protein LOC141754893 n=1 Tax=Sebastes fasciatus TaxID=394691 RepID=UPI003D9E07E9